MPDENGFYSDEEAKVKLDAFIAEINEIIVRYGLHSSIVVATLQKSPEHATRFASVVNGCNVCGMQTAAKVISEALPRDIGLFMTVLQKYVDTKHPLPSMLQSTLDPETEKLLTKQMAKDATGKPWKN
jgi:hypothetical protein